MTRREFIAGIGSALASPAIAQAQQQVLPVVGWLRPGAPPPHLVEAFHRGLADTGYVEGRNVRIESGPGLPEYDALREFAADLVHRRVAVIAAPGSTQAALAAKAATATIPIVFSTGGDPVQLGLVANLGRPDGNVTGYSYMDIEVDANVGSKQLGLVHDLVPQGVRFGALVNPKNPFAELAVKDLRAAAASAGRPIEVATASTDDELDTAFANLARKRVDALIAIPDAFLYQRRSRIVALAVRHTMPAVYWDRLFPEVGGLMSYGAGLADGFRQVGNYAGRILRGEKPADLPVLRPTQFELVINLKTAKALGLTLPPNLLAIADEVIE
jgi:putative tryptophan/tyrosine transport system substrate-binding protein